MSAPTWPRQEAVLAIHERLLSDFGGPSGLRDGGMLDSGLTRAEHLQAYGQPSVFELAATYAFGIIRNHPFVDGNKRTGFTVAVVFLELNGERFQASEVDATIQTLALAAGEFDEAGYAGWLKANCKQK